MKKFLLITILFWSSMGFSQDFRLTVSNSKMLDNGNQGLIDLGTFNAFDTAPTCATYSSPNSCYLINPSTVRLTLGFNYLIQIFNGSTLDVDFSFDNGNGGTENPFSNVTVPSSIMSAINNTSGVKSLVLDMPLRGSGAKSSYGGTLIIDVTHNP